jgi:putrescine transport system permease protein
VKAFLAAALAAGFAFLYAPIVVLVVYSFNRSQLVSVWAGFSTRWYGALLSDAPVLHAARISLEVATLSATLALAVGTLGGFVLDRFGVFRGRALFAGLLAAPLVMPDVIIGIALLLLFTALETATGWPAGRGVFTIVVGHATLCAAFVAVVVQGRLSGSDRSIEDAAADLGAGPAGVFLRITLPLLGPALITGWLLAFSLSLDDVVIASFLSGPGSSTLPMLVLSKVRLGINPEINALATLFILAVFLVTALAMLIGNRSRRQDVTQP